MRELTWAEWQKEGEALFGPDKRKWKFVCPVCGHVASVQEWLDAGAENGEVGFSCIGRRLPKPTDALAVTDKGQGPCNYAGGGLFRLNPVLVKVESDTFEFFEFAKPEEGQP